MADGDRPEAISREAHERVLKERDEFKAKTAELEQSVRALGIQSHAQAWLAGRGITDQGAQSQWMNLMGPTFGTMEFDSTDQLPGIFDEKFGKVIPQGDTPPPPTDTPPSDQPPPPQPAPTPQEVTVPGFANPQPGAGTPTAPEQMIKPFGEEWNRILSEQGQAGLEAAAQAGRIAWTGTQGAFPVKGRAS